MAETSTTSRKKVIRTKVVGVTKKNDDGGSRQRIIGNYVSAGDRLILVREPNNPYDCNAIAVKIDEYRQIGYLSGELAGELAPIMDAGIEIDCKVADITGGTPGRETRGVNLELIMLGEAESKARHEKAQTQSSKGKLRASPQKSRSVALLLCLFLGPFGAHHFYVGNIGMGFLYLFTGGFCFIGWIVDIFKIASGNFRDNRYRVV